MAQPIQTFAITAPGFYGLNTQDSSLDLASGFALTAVNCVIDKYGRIGARKGWAPQHTSHATLGTADIKSMGQLITDSGADYVIVAGNNRIYRYNGGSLTELTYGGGGVAPTITDSNWHMASLNEVMYLFQQGHDPLIFDPNVSTTTYCRVTEKAGYVGTVAQHDICISAYGRLWTAAASNDKTLIKFSDLLAGHIWNTGTSGSLDVTGVWPRGGDNITGLAAHNGFLYIFGRNAILIYSGANNPAGGVVGSGTNGEFKLYDTIIGTGCIARDTIQNTGDDIVFLSDVGLQSVRRLIQEKAAPFRDISKNVRDDLMSAVGGEVLRNIKSAYSPFESFYLLTLPSIKTVYCFDFKQQLPDGSARVTTWDSINPKSFCYLRDETLLIGKEGFVGKYTGYQDNGQSYRFQYFTNHTDLGEPSVTSVLKKLNVVVIGGSNQYITLKWGYDFTSNYRAQNAKIPAKGLAFFGISEYNSSTTEYTGGVNLETLTAYPTGSGKVVQTGYEADINGTPLSIQKIEIHAKNGKVV